MEEKITGSVGVNGQNLKPDVIVVQTLLIKAGMLPALNADGKTNADGICGRNTENAIKAFQSQKVGLSDPDGRIDPGGKTWKALVGSPASGGDTTLPKTSAEVFAQVKALFPNGVNVAIYCDYDKTGKAGTDNNNAEFLRAATSYAKFYNSLGIDANGNLKLGVPIGIKSLDQITQAVNQLHAVLKKEHERTVRATTPVPPPFTQVRVLALFSQGLPYGMKLKGADGVNLSIKTGSERANMQAFVQGIRPSLTEDVTAALFACHTGRETDGTEPVEVWHIDVALKQDGSSSFAAAFAAQLGKNASVYGHLSRGHTVDNYSARVFGKDAGKDATVSLGGVHIFNLLYPAKFVQSEATRLGKTADKVSDHMQKHYRKRMDESSKEDLQVPNPQGILKPGRLGALMFTDLLRARAFLQGDWATWVARNPV